MRNTEIWCYAIDPLTLTWRFSVFVTTWQTKGTIKEIPGPQTCSIKFRSGSVLSSVVEYCIAHGRSPSCPEAGRSTGAVTGAQDWAKASPSSALFWPWQSVISHQTQPSEMRQTPFWWDNIVGQSFFPVLGNLSSADGPPYAPADTPRIVFIQLITSQWYHLCIVVRALSKATAVFLESYSLHMLKDYSL